MPCLFCDLRPFRIWSYDGDVYKRQVLDQLGGIIDKKKETAMIDQWIRKLQIKTPSPDVPVDSLSGGNQQKVVLAKWLAADPKVLIVNEPTRGIDVGAKVEIYKLLEELCQQGIAVVMISSELPETVGIADRILIFKEGEIKGCLLYTSRARLCALWYPLQLCMPGHYGDAHAADAPECGKRPGSAL